MDMNKYCKNCGREVIEVEPVNGKRTYKCGCMDGLLDYQGVIPGWSRDARINQLKAMHNLMIEANDESVYMSWIYLIPDCPSEEDFVDIALDDEMYNACFDKFIRLIAKEGNRW